MSQLAGEPGSEWIEVNVPARARDRAPLLLNVVDPLVHEQFAGRLKTWFYFWEPELRLRLRWADHAQAERNRAELATFLDQAQAGRRDVHTAHGIRPESVPPARARSAPPSTFPRTPGR